jgi:hypothetical protein
MRKFYVPAGLLLAVVMAAGAFLASAAAGAEDRSAPPPAPEDPAVAGSTAAGPTAAGMEVMTRGPIHEAFAQPVSSGAVNQLVVPTKPPEAIAEVPPDEKPADENTLWIGGYWAWDDGRKDFDWVSGVWRVPPPNERWVAGYWTSVSGGYSWVPGFWTTTTAEDVVYYPTPPATLERGPTSDQPSSDFIWVAGCWRWVNARFAWQPGRWVAAQPDWIWSPASYCWSPRGWVFCNGYWDYRLDRRGLLFAPVSFTSPIFRRTGYTYCPSVVIDSAALPFYLFVRPDCSQYYFGDYYATSYDRLGIYPWFAVGRNPGYAYDPLFSFYSWRNAASNPNWGRDLRGWYTFYRAHPDQRLPHTLAATQRLLASAGNRPDRQFLRVANTLQSLQNDPQSSIRLAAVSSQQRIKFRENAGLMRQFGAERQKMEMTVGTTTGRGKLAGPNAMKMQKTPETLRFPAVARTLHENTMGIMGRAQGNLRQTMKPIQPPSSPEQRSETIQHEARKPQIQTQPLIKEGGSQGATQKKTIKSMDTNRPQGAIDKKMPKSTNGGVQQGGTQKQQLKREGKNTPPPNPQTQGAGKQSTSKGNNKDDGRKTP